MSLRYTRDVSFLVGALLLSWPLGCGEAEVDPAREYVDQRTYDDQPFVGAETQESDRPTTDALLSEAPYLDPWREQETFGEGITLLHSPEFTPPTETPNRGWRASIVFKRAGAPPPTGGYSTQPAISGRLVHQGRLCTATLIASNMAVTAAQCVGFTTNPSSPDVSLSFFVGGAQHVYRSVRWASFGESGGAADVALVQLAGRVPSSVAQIARLVRPGEAIEREGTLYGFGCDTVTQNNRLVLRHTPISAASGLGPPEGQAKLCPADAGGPILDPSGRRILGLASGLYAEEDLQGEIAVAWIPLVYERLMAHQTSWIGGCFSHTLERPVGEGGCVQRGDRACGAQDACAWVSCRAGKWACQGSDASSCDEGRELPNPACSLENSPAQKRTPASCFAREHGRHVPHGACMQLENGEGCGGRCQWMMCRDGGWVCPEQGDLTCADHALLPSARCLE